MKKVSSGCLSLCLALLMSLSLLSCSTEGTVQQILGTSVAAPVFLDCQSLTSTEVVFKFSRPVRVSSLNFYPAHEASVVREGREVTVAFTRPPAEGVKITADILVEDPDRNSLNVIVPFRSRNDRMPALVFNEVRLDYSRPRVELIEFFILESGNLGAMRLFIAHQSLTLPFYEFPPIEVKAGEYVVLHLRTLDEGSVDETGDDLSLSPGNEARANARDLWVSGSKKYMHSPNGLWLMDQDDRILDALLLSENPGTDGVNRTFMAAAEFLGQKKAWLPRDGVPQEDWIPGPGDAVQTRDTSATRTLNRDESITPLPSAANWYVTVNSGNTVGLPNNVRRHN